MNSRLDWLVLSDYYSIYVTNSPPASKFDVFRKQRRAKALRCLRYKKMYWIIIEKRYLTGYFTRLYNLAVKIVGCFFGNARRKI